MAQSRLTLHALIDTESSSWSHDALANFLGTSVALHILMKYPQPPLIHTNREDRLICTMSPSGQLTFKEACKMLQSHHHGIDSQVSKLLKIVWHCPGIMPRIRLFLWKLISDGVPIRGSYAARLGFLAPECSVCGQGQELVRHALFSCQFSKAYWYGSPLALRTDCIPQNLISLLCYICNALEPAQFIEFANLIWALWKNRCSYVIEGKKLDARNTYQLANFHNNLSKLSTTMQITGPLKHIWKQTESDRGEGVECYVDGSFQAPHAGGWAYILCCQGELKQYGSGCGNTDSSFSAELSAMMLAVREAMEQGLECCTFYTDCHQLQQILTGTIAIETVPWQNFHEVSSLVLNWRNYHGFHCKYLPREENLDAHFLANYARIHYVSCTGYTFPLFPL
ncbi:hypothetical protein LUZ61_020023 [Rhynchospora tenuis]|uniref:RNase H type-1 domain-containing protein n=1 Tax=Rhynchospora tenuis TaxID=198213 RepID=A0AAD6END7_9POAL|nr:hypothetical protein LUZ61_020023 [Rhynchospora tenuis]